MGLSRRRFTKEFKLAAVRRLEQGVSIGEAARALEVNPNVLHRWRREFRQGPGNVFPGNGKPRWSEGPIAELERKVGQQALEIDFLKGCLQHIEDSRSMCAGAGKWTAVRSTCRTTSRGTWGTTGAAGGPSFQAGCAAEWWSADGGGKPGRPACLCDELAVRSGGRADLSRRYKGLDDEDRRGSCYGRDARRSAVLPAV